MTKCPGRCCGMQDYSTSSTVCFWKMSPPLWHNLVPSPEPRAEHCRPGCLYQDDAPPSLWMLSMLRTVPLHHATGFQVLQLLWSIRTHFSTIPTLLIATQQRSYLPAWWNARVSRLARSPQRGRGGLNFCRLGGGLLQMWGWGSMESCICHSGGVGTTHSSSLFMTCSRVYMYTPGGGGALPSVFILC